MEGFEGVILKNDVVEVIVIKLKNGISNKMAVEEARELCH
jgi:hypothetical protein